MSVVSRLRCASVLGLSLLLLSSAYAHRSFMVPSSTVLTDTGRQWVTIDAARGNDLFFFNHNAMPVDSLHITAPDGSAVVPDKLERLRYRHVFDIQLTQPGTWQVAVVENGLRARWKENGTEKRWNGDRAGYAQAVPAQATDLAVSYVQSRIETFVTVGKPTTPKLSAQGLEARYLPHPNDLYASETSTITFYRNGQPAADLPVTLIAGGTRYRDQANEMRLKTNSDGSIRVTWPQAGLFWINASLREPEAAAPATSGSMSYTATVEVFPR